MTHDRKGTVAGERPRLVPPENFLQAVLWVDCVVLRADLGVMISASHNPHFDNGIKLFGPDGFKLPDHAEEAISAIVSGHISLAEPHDLGRARRMLAMEVPLLASASATTSAATSDDARRTSSTRSIAGDGRGPMLRSQRRFTSL